MPPLDLYARVRFLLVHFAHESAGAARIRHSLRPLLCEDSNRKARGASRRENTDAYPLDAYPVFEN